MNHDTIAGRRVLVTAAATGIGATVAARFAEAGARVFVCDVDAEALDRYLAAHPSITGRPADVAAPEEVAACAESSNRSSTSLDRIAPISTRS